MSVDRISDKITLLPVVLSPTPAPVSPVPAKVELAGAVSFGDPETLLNSREWLQAALEAKGATITGGGIGCGQADLGIELEGCPFTVSIRPIVRP